ncbi:trypsin-like peptidase domain-containing protein [Candidatus Jorgensenbacteria bacterium]|nr:trypsin-like peptidase domain-containing protein [Candidatus Jorgensenbacteria bacterium]
MRKSIFKFTIVISLVTLVTVLLLVAEPVKAGAWDKILNFLRGVPNASPGTTTVPQNTSPQAQVPLYKPTLDYEEAVIRAVESAAPSVVSIVISKDLPIIEQCPSNPFQDLPPEFRNFFGQGFGFQFYEPCQKGTKRQEVGGGTGFIVTTDGLILTNKHVVSDTKADYTVLTNDGKKYDAKVLARDPLQDLAVIKISALGLLPATLGNSDTIKLGQTAISIGNALGEFRNTVSVGVISGLSRDITASGADFGSESIQGVVQTDAAINPGNSGGPLLNLRGEVIGINTAIVAGAQNIGFAIPINQAKRDIESVKKTGAIKAAYLGVRYLMVSDEVAKKQKLSLDYGALVRGTEEGPAVVSGSPAAKAGLQAEDIILEVNGEKLDKGKTLGSVIQKYNIGDTVAVKVRRGDQMLTFTVKLEERPEG